MKKLLLIFALVLSLWPIYYFVIAGVTGNLDDTTTTTTEDVEVSVPPTEDPGTSSNTDDTPVPSDSGTSGTQTVQLEFDGNSYSCPQDTADRLNAMKRELAVLKLKVQAVKRLARAEDAELTKLDDAYPGGSAPSEVADRYNKLLATYKRHVRLHDSRADAFNTAIDAYNDLLRDECS